MCSLSGMLFGYLVVSKYANASCSFASGLCLHVGHQVDPIQPLFFGLAPIVFRAQGNPSIGLYIIIILVADRNKNEDVC